MPTQKTDKTQKSDSKQHTVQLLQKAYRMEVETVMNYLANSVYLDGMQAEEVKRALSADVTEELGHARRLAQRLKQIGGRIPGFFGTEIRSGILEAAASHNRCEVGHQRRDRRGELRHRALPGHHPSRGIER